MGWFKRRRESEYVDIVYATRQAADDARRRAEAAGLTFRYIEKREGRRYITYTGTDPEKAKAFLRKEPIADDTTYIVVETEDGVWGTDSSSLYLERLRAWQLDTDAVDCEGSIESLIDGFHNYLLAMRGTVDNFLAEIRCGRCRHAWIDGIRYSDVTRVRCPECRALNRVDSTSLVEVIDYR